MCFSATGSFALSGVLAGIGAASIARNGSKPAAMFAAIPFLFACQQAAEGFVWLTIGHEPQTLAHRLAVSVFLALALVVWPTWLPYSLRAMEQARSRRRVLTGLFAVGVGVSAFALLLLLNGHAVARVVGHSIRYEYESSSALGIHAAYLPVYLLATVVPFFVSTARLSRTIGVMLIVSLGSAALVERNALASVWCFFAAILSTVVLVAIERERRAHPILTGA